MTRGALARIQLDSKKPTAEMNEEMIRLNKKFPQKIELKAGKSEHNHSK